MMRKECYIGSPCYSLTRACKPHSAEPFRRSRYSVEMIVSVFGVELVIVIA